MERQDVCSRTQGFLKELIARDDGKSYLISTHGCAIRGMVNYLSDEPENYWLGHAPYNCSFTLVEAEGGKARIIDIDKVYYDSRKTETNTIGVQNESVNVDEINGEGDFSGGIDYERI